MSDMAAVIVPRSDQINADDLLAGPMTIKISSVKVSPGVEQPVSMFFDGSDKAYRPCKSMARCLVSAWGPDSSKYVGRSLTLYCDPKVKWGGLEVGGIRISHMSDIDGPITLALTVTRANKKPFTVRPLAKSVDKSANPQDQPVDKSPNSQGDNPARITAEQAATLETRCADLNVPLSRVKEKAGIDAIADMRADRYEAAMRWVEKQADAQPA